ncbi:MAG: hypothetical protein ACO3JJ_13215 [Opitutaceae bacterium]
MTPPRLAQILAAGGIGGVFCLGSPDPEERFLARRKLRVPRDVGLALLDKIEDRARPAGRWEDPVRIGAMAAELRLGRVRLHDLTTGEQPKVELVGGAWDEGKTLRPVRAGG